MTVRPSNSGISRDDWLKALQDAETHDPDALTVSEIAEIFGMSQQSARRRLRLLVENGSALQTRKRTPRGTFTAYRLLTVPPKKGRKH